MTDRNYQPETKELVFGTRINPDGVTALRCGHADFDVANMVPKLDSINADIAAALADPPPETTGPDGLRL